MYDIASPNTAEKRHARITKAAVMGGIFCNAEPEVDVMSGQTEVME